MNNQQPETKLNYIYFGIFLTLLILISTSNILTKESVSELKIFFFLYALGQSFLELTLILLLGEIVQRFLGKIGFSIFIAATFGFLILHLSDFVTERILDLSIWETLSFVFDETLSNFLYLLDASGIALWMWGILFFLIGIFPLFGILLYYWLGKLSQTKPFFLKKEWLFQSFICLPLALLSWEYSNTQLLQPNSYSNLLKSLPWKFTFLQPKSLFFSIPKTLKTPHKEKEALAIIEKNDIQLKSKPNIYLFVVESFREDFITPEFAPHLHQFKQEHHHFPLAFSNGNATHLSWFSIFHSQFPYYWRNVQQSGWEMGSPPINLLKKWGYQLRVYSSAELSYYGMEELLFGKNRKLIDAFHPFHHPPPCRACDSDAFALDQLTQDLKDPSLQEGQLMIVFWDSTHFNYSWPESKTPKFTPLADNISYFQFFQSQETIAKIKNNYKNAIFYIDSLFGNFIENLPHPEEAIVVVTGDHGEEFFEKGNLFHGSHLVHEQMNIPLYMKFGQAKSEKTHELVSQMDIFPSICHYLSGEETPLCKGTSIFSEKKHPFTLTARFNAGRTPYEFCLHNGKYKCIFQFSDKKNIFASKMLRVQSLCQGKDKEFCAPKKQMNEWLEKEFGPAFDQLFERK